MGVSGNVRSRHLDEYIALAKALNFVVDSRVPLWPGGMPFSSSKVARFKADGAFESGNEVCAVGGVADRG